MVQSLFFEAEVVMFISLINCELTPLPPPPPNQIYRVLKPFCKANGVEIIVLLIVSAS